MKKLAVFAMAATLLLVVSSPAVAQFGEVVYKIDGMDDVTVRNVEFRVVDGTSFTMDVYYPPDMDSTSPLPVVILTNGARDSRVKSVLPVGTREFDIYVDWAQLIAASGMIAVLYDSEQPDDLIELVSYIQQNANALQIDGERIATLGFSSNCAVGLSYIMQTGREHVKAAAFYYCDMITPDGKFNAAIDEFNENMPGPGERGFYLTTELEPITLLRSDLPVLVVRTGEHGGENPSIDHFVSQALVYAVPITLINYQEGMHGFDYQLDTTRSREIIAFTLQFLKSNLGVE
jgi:dienelactone hydrolase